MAFENAPHNERQDCYGRKNVYEAILAHEKGHARYYFSTIVNEFKQRLIDANIDDGLRDYDAVIDLINATFNSTWDAGLVGSNNNADSALMNWFASHANVWRPINDLGDYKRWKKE